MRMLPTAWFTDENMSFEDLAPYLGQVPIILPAHQELCEVKNMVTKTRKQRDKAKKKALAEKKSAPRET